MHDLLYLVSILDLGFLGLSPQPVSVCLSVCLSVLVSGVSRVLVFCSDLVARGMPSFFRFSFGTG